MARCDGCAGSRCSCKIIAGANVVVAGVGTSTDPYVITSQGEEGQAVPTGAIIMFTTAVPPAGWLVANGQAVSRTTYAALFAVIGTTYGDGGGGGTHFTLPDLAGAFPFGADGTHALASTGGAETSTLVTANLPPHTHTIAHQHAIDHGHVASTGDSGYHDHGGATAANFAGNQHGHSGSAFVQSGGGLSAALGIEAATVQHAHTIWGDGIHSHTVSVIPFAGLSGASSVANSGTLPAASAFSNMPPYLALTFLIKT